MTVPAADTIEVGAASILTFRDNATALNTIKLNLGVAPGNTGIQLKSIVNRDTFIDFFEGASVQQNIFWSGSDDALIIGGLANGVIGIGLSQNVGVGTNSATSRFHIKDSDAGGNDLLLISSTGKANLKSFADQVALTVQGHSTQTADIFRVENDAAAVLFKVGPLGQTTITGTANALLLKVDADSGQTGAIVEINSSTVTLFEIGQNGKSFFQSDANVEILKIKAHSSTAGSTVTFRVTTSGNATRFGVNNDGDCQIAGDLNHDGAGVGFYGTAPVAKPAVTGSRGGNAALADLLTDLASQGLITDSTTA